MVEFGITWHFLGTNLSSLFWAGFAIVECDNSRRAFSYLLKCIALDACVFFGSSPDRNNNRTSARRHQWRVLEEYS